MALKWRRVTVLLLCVVITQLFTRFYVFPRKQANSRKALVGDENALDDEIWFAAVVDVARDVAPTSAID